MVAIDTARAVVVCFVTVGGTLLCCTTCRLTCVSASTLPSHLHYCCPVRWSCNVWWHLQPMSPRIVELFGSTSWFTIATRTGSVCYMNHGRPVSCDSQIIFLDMYKLWFIWSLYMSMHRGDALTFLFYEQHCIVIFVQIINKLNVYKSEPWTFVIPYYSGCEYCVDINLIAKNLCRINFISRWKSECCVA